MALMFDKVKMCKMLNNSEYWENRNVHKLHFYFVGQFIFSSYMIIEQAQFFEHWNPLQPPHQNVNNVRRGVTRFAVKAGRG